MAKIYLSPVPNSSYITAKGQPLYFDGSGKLEVADVEVIAELDAAIAARANIIELVIPVAVTAEIPADKPVAPTETVSQPAATAATAATATK